jgi:carboxyl-terminal processing protease
MISQVYDGPAKDAGMKVGDYIVGVDGKTFEEMGGYQNVIYFVRGDVGTEVTVTVNRNGNLIDITMTRALVEDKSVSYELLDGGYGYIAITQFNDNTAKQFREAVEALEDLGACGYIFDVRLNGGGYVHSVVEILSYILPSGKVVISYQYKGEPKRYQYTSVDILPEDEGGRGDHVIDLPMVVLCDEYTASAAEIFVSCLRDYDGVVADFIDVTIVGQNTFGKGIMQGSVSYPPDNSYVTLTVSYYNPPSGINYHGVGIMPDVLVELTETEDTQLAEAIKQMEILLNCQ